MEVSRRSFLKRGLILGTTGAGAGMANVALAAPTKKAPYKLRNVQEVTNICCYCSGGCGLICSTREGQLINLEGDPDHPVNVGALCPKGATMWGIANIVTADRKPELHPYRVKQPLVRRPYTKTWEKLTWDQAAKEIARHIKDTRDATFVEQEKGITVNRCDGIASFGAAQLNNEECWLVQKFIRSLGLYYVDNQARVCHSSTVAGFAPTFGRGSMTNHWNDFQNSDVILTIGSNNAENHPISSRWVERAQDRGGTWIVVDPRFSRSAARADIYGRIRPGTDIAFFGGLINYILENELFQHEYVANYTNASCLIKPEFDFNVNEGLFTGWDPQTKSYDHSAWGYDLAGHEVWQTEPGQPMAWVKEEGVPKFTPPEIKILKKDMTLKHPRCVLSIMRKHYSRYTLDKVSRVTGLEKPMLEKIYKIYASTGAPEKAGSILYALGQTQHSYGTQNCRSMCVTQLLLGNVGIAGGGMNALRGEPNVQGSTDTGPHVSGLAGYLKAPHAKTHPSLAKYCEVETYPTGFYTNKPKFVVSMLREWFGENATVENDYLYDLLPKCSPDKHYHDYSTLAGFYDMASSKIKGYMLWGMNPAHSTANAKFARHAMANLDWMVSVDLFQTETSTFWEAPDMKPEEIKTEVYVLPAVAVYEKIGSINNSGRWIQWREKAIEPPGEAKPDFWILMRLWEEIRALYEKEGGKCPDQILKTNMDYYIDGEPNLLKICWALNGYDVKTGKLLSGIPKLKADGSTACGIWIWSGYYNNEEAKMDPLRQPLTRRSKDDPSGLGVYGQWSFSWPSNRRILYNRASCDMKGKPWNPKRTLVEWMPEQQKWKQYDNGDFVTSRPPDGNAFMMLWEQNARLFCYAMADAPLPEHFEPVETPLTKNPFNGSLNNPMALFTERPNLNKGTVADYPYVVTTYSVVEHWQTGTFTRNIPWLVEMIPCNYVEISEQLAAEKGIKPGDMVRVWNGRGDVKVAAMVTKRMQPMQIEGKVQHVVGLPHHFSWCGNYATGDNINDLSPNVGDPNSYIPEFKAFLVNLEKA